MFILHKYVLYYSKNHIHSNFLLHTLRVYLNINFRISSFTRQRPVLVSHETHSVLTIYQLNCYMHYIRFSRQRILYLCVISAMKTLFISCTRAVLSSLNRCDRDFNDQSRIDRGSGTWRGCSSDRASDSTVW